MKKVLTKSLTFILSMALVMSSFMVVSFADTASANGLTTPVIKNYSYVGRDYIKLDWGTIANADGYKVYRKKADGPWKRIAVIKGKYNSDYRDENVSGSYYYSVRAFKYKNGKTADSRKSDVMKFRTLRKTSINVTGNDDKNTIKWKRVPYATGYRVYERIGKNGSWEKLASLGDVTSFTTSKTGHGCYHYYKVRPVYHAAGGEASLGNYSNIDEFMWYHDPDISVYMSDYYEEDTYFVAMEVTNNSSNDYMRIISNEAYLIDSDYDSFDRILKLINVEYDSYGNAERYYPVKSVAVKPGMTKTVFFEVEGDSTWYDEESFLCYQFIYDGVKYNGTSSAYYGTTWEEV